MKVDELSRLIKGGETSLVEFKVAPPRYAELAERVCAFANSSIGGTIVIGVQDKSWEIIGIKDVSRARDIMLQAARHCQPTVQFQPAEPELIELEGKLLLVGQIPPNAGSLYQAGGVSWMRRGTHSVPLSVDEIEAFLFRRGSLVWETRPLERARLKDLDLRAVEKFLTNRSQRVTVAGSSDEESDRTKMEELLVNLECAAWIHDEKGQPVICPTAAGLLLFGKHPQNFLIQAEAICTLYPDEHGLRRFAERRVLHGTIPQQVDQAEAFFRQFVPVAGWIEGFHRRDEPDYPLEALREAVVNALVHRDYSLKGEAVRIFYYQNRVEIHSPGLLLPGITLSDLSAGRVRSRPRNPVIASVLRDFPGGYMERLGTGIRFMLAQMQNLGLDGPDFRELDEFIVTFQKGGSHPPPPELAAVRAATSEIAPVVTTPTLPLELEAEVMVAPEAPAQLVAGVGAETFTRQRRLQSGLGYIREHGSISNQEYRDLTGASANTALRDLEELVEQGSLKRVGKRRAARYELP